MFRDISHKPLEGCYGGWVWVGGIVFRLMGRIASDSFEFIWGVLLLCFFDSEHGIGE